MSKPRRPAQERSAELRAVLGCHVNQRTVDRAREVMAENEQLRRALAALQEDEKEEQHAAE